MEIPNDDGKTFKNQRQTIDLSRTRANEKELNGSSRITKRGKVNTRTDLSFYLWR